VPDFSALQSCATDGGVFGLVIPPVVFVLLLLELVWLFAVVTRELKARSDLLRVRDLVIEGSVGQAILVADAHARDDVMMTCRSAIVAAQSGSIDDAFEKLKEEAGHRFAPRSALLRDLALLLLVAVPLALGGASRLYAERVARAAAAGTKSAPAAVMDEIAAEPAFTCPPQMSLAGALLLALPAVAIFGLLASRRSDAARKRALSEASVLAEMTFRVVSHRAYAQEREARARAG